MVKKAQDRFNTTLDEDIQILEKFDMSDEAKQNTAQENHNIKNCLLLRIGEKRILRFWLETADIVLNLASLSFSEAQRKCNFDLFSINPSIKDGYKIQSYIEKKFLPLLK